jgi:hypothetical protein
VGDTSGITLPHAHRPTAAMTLVTTDSGFFTSIPKLGCD